MKGLVSTLASCCLVAALLFAPTAYAQYDTGEGFDVSWTLDPRDHPDLFDHGPAFGARSVLTGMDFDGDGMKEILFTTDETLAPGGPDPGSLDVFLFEATGDDTYEYVWHYTHEPSNSLPPIAYGDMDGDERWEIYFGVPTLPDAADDLLIFEQNEDGTFPDEPTVRYGYDRPGSDDFRPAGFVIGDFDDDGNQELATVSRTSSARELVVIEPTAGIDEFATFNIEFEVGEAVLGGGALYDVDAADFDNDGAMEIWVNTWDNFSWAIFEATGANTYALRAEINGAKPDVDPGSFNSHKLLFHDADGDGRIELLAPMTNGKLYYLDDVDDVSTIDGDSFVEVGTFDPTASARGADLGDIDGDGRFDIVTANGTQETVTRIEYNGYGNPADSTSYTWTVILDSSAEEPGERYYPLRISDDLDGDGQNEIVVTNLFASDDGQDVIVVIESTTRNDIHVANDMRLTWTLDPRDYPDLFDHGPAFGARSVLTGMDFDGDGNKEFLFTTDETLAPGGPDPGSLDIYLYEATGNDSYEHVWHYTHEPSNSLPPVAYGDMDGDGLWEIYFGVPTLPDAADDLLIFEQNEDGTFPDEPTVRYGYDRPGSDDFRPAGFVIGDFDDDGNQELATVSRTSAARELVVIEPTAGIDAFATFDIEFEVGEAVLGGGALYDVDAADFDNDGSMEIWVNTWDNFSWAIFEATGEDTYALRAEINGAKPDVDPGSFNSHKLLFHDADGDGRMELLAPMTNGKLYYLDDVDDVSTITGDSFVEVGTFDRTASARGADLGDIDGDGNFDIVTADGTAETVTRIEYNGSGSPADSSSYTWTILLDSSGDDLGERYYPLRIADDLDGDGMNEVVVTNLFASDEGQPLIVIAESTTPTDVENPTEVPAQFVLRQNYPNPFNPTTTIEYELKTSSAVSIRVYDSLGRLVSTLVGNQMQTAGTYSVQWDGTSDAGAQVASGVYFYTLESRDFREARQMVLMK